MAGKKTIEWIGYVLEETIRILGMQLVLVPAAYVLPRKWALKIASAVALPLAILPRPGINTYWQMRRAFGKNRKDSFHLSWGWLARPFRDFIIMKRILYKRENPARWKIVERNADAVKNLRESGESYIVATGHFARAAILGMSSPRVTYGRYVGLSHRPPGMIRRIYDLRMRIQFGTQVKAVTSCWDREMENVFIGSDPLPFRTLYNRLCERGNVVFIHADAPWKKAQSGAFVRPFAGHRRRVFATGTAQLAQMSQCPILCCVYFLESDGTIVLEWGPLIRNADMEQGNVIDVMYRLIDRLEIAIGERPTQYIFEIGYDRRWNSKSKQWEDITD